MDNGMGKVFLVGAGCGGKDWITVRGLELLRRCDAVVYDDLIGGELLEEAPPSAVRLYVGKRSGRHACPQEEICRMLADLAREGKQTVRLKGGDPYVFGRGAEEAQALLDGGIPFEEVPGISSAIAIPAGAGIPVTARGVSQSVHIITAHTADTPDGLPACFDLYGKLQGTLVFLMGLAQLPAIVARLESAGMPPDTPAAVVSGGNAPMPGTARGTLDTIVGAVAAAGIVPPGVIVVGAVAGMTLLSRETLPLQGVPVGLVGTASMTEKLSRLLKEKGAVPFVQLPVEVEPIPFAVPEELLRRDESQFVVFTSSNGVRLFFQQMKRQRLDIRRLARCRFAVIGAATGETLEAYGVYADLCPTVYSTEMLGKALLDQASGGEKLWLFRSAQGEKSLPEMLEKRFRVRDIPIYQVRAGADREELRPAKYLVLSSGSGAAAYLDRYGAPGPDTRCVCIGASTARELTARWNGHPLIASKATGEGILETILWDHQRKG